MATDINLAVEKFTEEIGWQFIGYESEIWGGDVHKMKRNYGLYCILANQKDDYEMIDENTTLSYIPIVEPRGIPADADKTESYATRPFQKDPYDRWFPSWVTLKEILDYPYWNKYVLLRDHASDQDGRRITYAERCQEFLGNFVPKLLKLADRPEYLRIIYYFD